MLLFFTLTRVKSPLTWRDWDISAMWTLRYTQDYARSLMPNSKARPPRETSTVKVTHSSLPQLYQLVQTAQTEETNSLKKADFSPLQNTVLHIPAITKESC